MPSSYPYSNLDHALRRAFGDPRESYGATLYKDHNRGTGLSPLDQITQDGITRQVLEVNLTAGQRFILYLCYDTTGQQHYAHVALTMYTEMFATKSNSTFVLESVARWTRRSKENSIYPKEAMHSLGMWASTFGCKISDLRYARFKIYKQLDAILNNALGAAFQLLAERNIIPGIDA